MKGDRRCQAGLHSSAVLLLERHEAKIVVAGRGNAGHDAHDGAVVGILVAPDVDARIVSRLGDRLEPRHDLVDPDFGLLEVNLALAG